MSVDPGYTDAYSNRAFSSLSKKRMGKDETSYDGSRRGSKPLEQQGSNSFFTRGQDSSKGVEAKEWRRGPDFASSAEALSPSRTALPTSPGTPSTPVDMMRRPPSIDSVASLDQTSPVPKPKNVSPRSGWGTQSPGNGYSKDRQRKKGGEGSNTPPPYGRQNGGGKGAGRVLPLHEDNVPEAQQVSQQPWYTNDASRTSTPLQPGSSSPAIGASPLMQSPIPGSSPVQQGIVSSTPGTSPVVPMLQSADGAPVFPINYPLVLLQQQAAYQQSFPQMAVLHPTQQKHSQSDPPKASPVQQQTPLMVMQSPQVVTATPQPGYAMIVPVTQPWQHAPQSSAPTPLTQQQQLQQQQQQQQQHTPHISPAKGAPNTPKGRKEKEKEKEKEKKTKGAWKQVSNWRTETPPEQPAAPVEPEPEDDFKALMAQETKARNKLRQQATKGANKIKEQIFGKSTKDTPSPQPKKTKSPPKEATPPNPLWAQRCRRFEAARGNYNKSEDTGMLPSELHMCDPSKPQFLPGRGRPLPPPPPSPSM